MTTATKRTLCLPLTTAQQSLVEANERLIGWALKRWGHGVHPHRDEANGATLLDALLDGLIRAAQRYDPTRGTTFATCAGWWLRQAAQRWREAHRKQQPFGTSLEHDPEDTDAPDVLVEWDDARAALRQVWRWRHVLPAYLWRPLWQRYGRGRSYREIAAREGTKPGTIKERVRRAVELLRDLEGVRT